MSKDKTVWNQLNIPLNPKCRARLLGPEANYQISSTTLDIVIFFPAQALIFSWRRFFVPNLQTRQYFERDNFKSFDCTQSAEQDYWVRSQLPVKAWRHSILSFSFLRQLWFFLWELFFVSNWQTRQQWMIKAIRSVENTIEPKVQSKIIGARSQLPDKLDDTQYCHFLSCATFDLFFENFFLSLKLADTTLLKEHWMTVPLDPKCRARVLEQNPISN